MQSAEQSDWGEQGKAISSSAESERQGVFHCGFSFSALYALHSSSDAK